MKKRFIVLGIYEVHNASACLMIDGNIVAASHEERFSKIKNDVGMPIKAAKFCLNFANIKPEEVDEVAISNKSFNKNGIANVLLKRPAIYKIEDWNFENNFYWKKKLFEKSKVDDHYFYIMSGEQKVKKLSHYYDTSKINFKDSDKKIEHDFNVLRKKVIEDYLGIDKKKVKFVEHYLCHHYHAYYSSPYRGNDVVVAHLEGDGGRYNNAVSIPTKKGLKILSGSKTADIGRLYQWMTLLLGMRPYHDEYKVMGLAPYATKSEIQKSLKHFNNIFKITNNLLNITYKKRPRDLYYTFKEKLEGHRFDGIAGALQETLNSISIQWMKGIKKRTGRNVLCYGGGVAMNVKTNGIISNLKEFKNIFVPLSPSDESNAIGACYYATEKRFIKDNKNILGIKPLSSPYLGPDINVTGLDKYLPEIKKYRGNFKIYNNISNKFLSKEIYDGKIIGRAVGRAEFGQRALGNRSIIANPNFPEITEKINNSIKYRDFWMPFCPTVLDKFQSKVILNKKNLSCKYMTNSFSLNDKYKLLARGASHPGDNTVRPQILKEKDNKSYYQLINSFNKISKIPLVINTSLNMHREPMATDLSDVISILKRSQLDGMVINNHFIKIFKK